MGRSLHVVSIERQLVDKAIVVCRLLAVFKIRRIDHGLVYPMNPELATVLLHIRYARILLRFDAHALAVSFSLFAGLELGLVGLVEAPLRVLDGNRGRQSDQWHIVDDGAS